jgi:beta-galactosidase
MDFTESLPVPDWTNLSVVHRNTLLPRASFFNYGSEDDALTLDTSRAKMISLSGTWKFKVFDSPYDLPETESGAPIDTSEYGNILVPGMWQLQGYGKGPQYTNMYYNFPVDPPNVPLFENETGHYVRSFNIPAAFRDHQIRIRFEGVDSAFHLSINGVEVGYSQGSRNPSEFDITENVSPTGDNILAVTVYQKCNGSYLEDQVTFDPSRRKY